jgi:hypothetical protein
VSAHQLAFDLVKLATLEARQLEAQAALDDLAVSTHEVPAFGVDDVRGLLRRRLAAATANVRAQRQVTLDRVEDQL